MVVVRSLRQMEDVVYSSAVSIPSGQSGRSIQLVTPGIDGCLDVENRINWFDDGESLGTRQGGSVPAFWRFLLTFT